jgi:hypothetical protein
MEDEVSCALCGLRIAPRKDFVFRVDGRIEHVKCPVPAPKPPNRDAICPACSMPIRPTDSVAKEGGEVVHVRCLTPRPIAGGAGLPA